nr:MAG TPA: hypothetical protein [Caudoviricetes sp.]
MGFCHENYIKFVTEFNRKRRYTVHMFRAHSSHFVQLGRHRAVVGLTIYRT